MCHKHNVFVKYTIWKENGFEAVRIKLKILSTHRGNVGKWLLASLNNPSRLWDLGLSLIGWYLTLG